MPTKSPVSRTFVAEIAADPDGSSMTAIPVPFDPREVFGKARAPVVVSIGAHSFRSTVCSMGGGVWVPLRRSNREAAGVTGGQRVSVTLTLDDQPRTIALPRDLAAALKAAGATAKWKALSYSHQREHVEAIEEAKKPETRIKRIAACVAMVAERPDATAQKNAAGTSRASTATKAKKKSTVKTSVGRSTRASADASRRATRAR